MFRLMFASHSIYDGINIEIMKYFILLAWEGGIYVIRISITVIQEYINSFLTVVVHINGWILALHRCCVTELRK